MSKNLVKTVKNIDKKSKMLKNLEKTFKNIEKPVNNLKNVQKPLKILKKRVKTVNIEKLQKDRKECLKIVEKRQKCRKT